MTAQPRNNYRYPYATLLIACGLLGGCAMPDSIHSAFSAPDSDTAQAPAGQTASSSPATAVSASNATSEERHMPGTLHFILGGTIWGDYEGWKIQILSAQTNKGFKPFHSSSMQIDDHLKVDLWPDHYHVIVTLNNQTVYNGMVEIKAGRSTVVLGDISLFSNAVQILNGEPAKQQMERWGLTTRQVLDIRQTFVPLSFVFIPGIEGRYDGPRNDNMPAGKGQLTLHKNQTRIAIVEEVVVEEDGTLTGEPVFDDGRRIENYDISSGDVPPGATTHYQDGREFQGRYEGMTPKEGTMSYPDGQRWIGTFANDVPQGKGNLRMTDGTTIDDVPSMNTSTFDGSYDCVSPAGHKATCYYFEGERITSEKEYKQQIGWRRDSLAEAVRQAEELAAAAQAKAEQQAVSPPPAPSTPPPAAIQTPAPIDGCSALSGQFATSTNLSRIRFDGNGRGDFWQATTGGPSKYFFEVSFSYSGSRNSIQFSYDEAVYKDAGGRVMRRQAMPGGSSACSFNGRILNIGGTEYIKQ